MFIFYRNETKNGNKELTAAPTEENGTKNNDNKKGRYGKTTKRLGSVWRHAAGEQLEQVRRTLAADTVEHEESVIGKLSISLMRAKIKKCRDCF